MKRVHSNENDQAVSGFPLVIFFLIFCEMKSKNIRHIVQNLAAILRRTGNFKKNTNSEHYGQISSIPSDRKGLTDSEPNRALKSSCLAFAILFISQDLLTDYNRD